MKQADRIPIVVVAGFLGAGKTSLLREVLPRMVGGERESYVILNDYENAAIDVESLRGLGERVEGIAAGCVCCDASQGLEIALLSIPEGGKSMVWLEANGTTDTQELLSWLALAPALRERFGPIVQVVVINEARWQKRVLPGDRRLEMGQMVTASVVVSNRREQASYKQRLRVQQDVAEKNARARWMSVEELAECVLGGNLWVETGVEKDGGEGMGGHRHWHSAVRVEMPEVVREEDLRWWLMGLPREVLRVKGLVKLEDGQWCYFNRTDDAFEKLSLVKLEGRDGLEASAVMIGVGLGGKVVLGQEIAAGEQKGGIGSW